MSSARSSNSLRISALLVPFCFWTVMATCTNVSEVSLTVEPTTQRSYQCAFFCSLHIICCTSELTLQRSTAMIIICGFSLGINRSPAWSDESETKGRQSLERFAKEIKAIDIINGLGREPPPTPAKSRIDYKPLTMAKGK